MALAGKNNFDVGMAEGKPLIYYGISFVCPSPIPPMRELEGKKPDYGQIT